MKRIVLGFIGLLFSLNLAFAQAPVAPFITFDNGGTQAVSKRNPLPVGFSQQVTSIPTVQNAAYASGNCVGSFNAVTVSNIAGQTAFLTNMRVLSLSGATPTLTLYVFNANPSTSVCTDKSTFTLANADVDKLIFLPTAVSLSAPTGTTISFGSTDLIPVRPFIAGGSTSSGVNTIYYALVSGSIFTPGSTTDIHVNVGVALN